MALTSFEIVIYEGQTATPRITFTNTNKTDGTFSLVKFTKTEKSLFQSGTLVLFKGVAEPIINDKVVIKLNTVTKFVGYIAGINRSLKGDKVRTLDLIGNTKKLFRERVGSSEYYYQNMWTSDIVRSLVRFHTTLDWGSIPAGVGTYIDGAYDFEDYIVGDAVNKISHFDNYRLFVDENDVVQYYIPSAAVKTITESDIVSIGSIEKSDELIYNDVTVIGGGTVKAHTESAASITTYGRFPKTFKEPKLNDQADATSLASKYLTEYKNPVWEGSIVIQGDETIDVSQKLNLSLTNIAISESVEVTQIEHSIIASKGFTTKITFGRIPYNPGEDFASLRMNIDEDLDQIYDALADAATAQSTADGKIVTFYQDAPPTADGVGDIWFDTNDDNKAYRWNGSNWILARDDGIVEAIGDAANAQATADGKVVTFYVVSTSPPTAEGVGDLWVQTDNNEKLYRWNGSSWAEFKKGDVTGDHESDIDHDNIGGRNETNHHPVVTKNSYKNISNPSYNVQYYNNTGQDILITVTPRITLDTANRTGMPYVEIKVSSAVVLAYVYSSAHFDGAAGTCEYRLTLTFVVPIGHRWKYMEAMGITTAKNLDDEFLVKWRTSDS